MRKKQSIHLSKIVCGIFIAISLFVYACPLVSGMRVSADTLRMVMCSTTSEVKAIGDFDGMSASTDCFRSHNVIAGYLTGVVQENNLRFWAITLLGLAMLFVFSILHYFIRASFFGISLWRPLRRSWRCYRASVRVHIQKKISAWFAFMRNDTFASHTL